MPDKISNEEKIDGRTLKMELTKENLMKSLTDYFGLNNREGTHFYELIIQKSSLPKEGAIFQEDFVGFSKEHIEELSLFILGKFSTTLNAK